MKQFIKEYFEERYIKNNDTTAIILPDQESKQKWKLMIKTSYKDKFIWKKASATNILELREDIKREIIEYEKTNAKYMAQYVGFMSKFKDDRYMVFKVKNFANKRSTGARCDQSSKSAALQILENILDYSGQDEEHKKSLNNKKNIQLCILQELYLRYYNYNKHNDKVWFVTPVQAIILKL